MDPAVGLLEMGGAPLSSEPHAIVVGGLAADIRHDDLAIRESGRADRDPVGPPHVGQHPAGDVLELVEACDASSPIESVLP